MKNYLYISILTLYSSIALSSAHGDVVNPQEKEAANHILHECAKQYSTKDEIDKCMIDPMQTLANGGNCFAHYIIVQYYQRHRDEKNASEWWEKATQCTANR